MIEVTVQKLAEEIQVTIERLLQQLAAAGIDKDRSATVTEQEKERLLTYLNSTHNSSSIPSSAVHGNTTSTPSRLTLQRKTHSTLSISSSGGKSKFIQVEVRKNRTYVKRDAAELVDDSATPAEISSVVSSAVTPSSTLAPGHSKERVAVKNLVNQPGVKQTIERSSRLTVPPVRLPVAAPSKPAAVAKKPEPMSEKDRLLAIEKAKLEAQATELKRKAEEEARRKAEENAKQLAVAARKLVEENEKRWEQGEQQPAVNEEYHLTTSSYAREAEDEEDRRDESGRRSPARSSKAVKQKKGNKLLESTKAAREEERANTRGRGRPKPSALQQSFNRPVQPVTRDIVISQTITVAELAAKMAVKSAQVIKAVMKLGTIASINQALDQGMAQLVAEEMGHKVTLQQANQLETDIMSDRNVDSEAQLVPRAPVVTIMGHVDHGKTSLLDYIRSTKVAAKEAGGITQHIGAYHVETESGTITFLDTPGHAAFTAMRSRGAKATDIIILVVAADDGVMPQTIEAIQHARAANVPLVVAINKMDKPGADAEHIQQALSQQGVLSEAWGGDTQFVQVSAKTGTGIDNLLNAILLQAEILELKAVPSGMASGIVIESFLDRGRGPVATILVQQGILNKGDTILCGFEYGRVRAMRDELGKEISTAGPSMPVEVLGLSGVSTAGDPVTVVRDEKKARELALHRQSKQREVKLAGQQRAKLEHLFIQASERAVSEVNLVIKADVQGSAEAISDALLNLSTEEVKVRIIGAGVGALTETDATLAAASNAILIGFNVRADSSARRIIENEGLDLRYYSVIYHIIDEVKQAMSGLLAPEYKQQIIGLAEVRDLFRSPKFDAIAGCMVKEGMIKRHSPIRVLRDNVVIYEGELESLRRFKDDVSEVRSGMECGVGVKNYRDVRSGDVIEVYETIEIQRSID